jgi:tetratricopeptide (TPR) repeat protein
VGAAASRATIEQLYQSAQNAKSVQELEQSLAQIEQLQLRGLDPDNQQYLTQLQAWLLNRRGEAYALAAGRVSEAGNEQDAVRWEEAAVADFAASIELHPQWRAYHNQGVSLAMLGNYDEALANFEQAISLNPQYPNTRFNRAELWLELGEYGKAEQEYSAVIQLSPDDVDSRVGRGHARFYLGRFEESLQDFNDVLTRQPENAVAYADRADLYAYLGRWEQSARDYRMAIKLDKTLGRAYQSAAWLMATCPDERFRDATLAMKAAQRAVELDGTGDYRYLDTLAAAHANAQQFDQAVQTVQQAIQAAPTDVQQELGARLAQYQARQPFRDAPH